jgi:sec-independent protein translocase protein TatC
MTVLEHLEELRTRLIKLVIAFLVASAICWFLYDEILELLIRPLRGLPESSQILTDGNLIITAPQEAFFVRLKVTAYAGFVLALPVILWQAWQFVAPGLFAREKRFAVPFVVASLALFLAGAAFAFAILPQALRVLAAFGGTEIMLLPRASDYLSFVLLLVLAFGIAFEMPLVLLSLTLVGVISSGTLRRSRRVAWVLILILAAVVTPTQDPYTLIIMALPLGLLYEATILIARLAKR